MEPPLKIFVSSMIGELESERVALQIALEQLPLTRPWVFEYTPPAADALEESYLRHVQNCDLLVLLVGQSISDPVRREWKEATDLGKQRLAFLKGGTPGPRSPEAEAFVGKIDVKWRAFGDARDLAGKATEAVVDLLIQNFRQYQLQPADVSALAGVLADLQAQATQTAAMVQKTANDMAAVQAQVSEVLAMLRRAQGRLPVKAPEEMAGAYLAYLLERYRYLDFRGIGPAERMPLRLPLLEMYVPLSARPELPPGETWERQRERLELAGREFDEETVAERTGGPVSLLELLTGDDREGLVILGDPGAGKTTFLKYLALRLARGDGPELGLGGARLPILLPLATYATALAEKDVSLQDFLPEYYRLQNVRYDLGPLFAAALEAGQAVVLLDGLDEVREPGQRQQVVDHVLDFYTWHRGKGNRCVLTSRVVGYREAPLEAEGLTECTLVDFGDEEIEQFARCWCTALEQAALGDTEVAKLDAERECADLLAAVRRNPGVRRLAANPLMLTVLALMKRQGVTLPERRAELYDRYVETLLSTWNRARSLDPGRLRELDVADTVRTLAPLALWMHEEKPGVGLAPRGDVLRRLTEHYRFKGTPPDKAEDQARQFLDDVRRHAGLFLERGVDSYGFIHLTFEEYLSAVAIARQGQRDVQTTIEQLCRHLTDPEWREVVLLTVGYLGVVQQWEEVASDVVEGILDHELADDERGINVVVAGQAVRDVQPTGVTADCRSRVVGALGPAMADPIVPVQTRIEVGNVLGDLGDPRFQVQLIAGVEVIEPPLVTVPEGPFLMGIPEGKVDELRKKYGGDVDYWRRQTPQREVHLPTFEMGAYPVTNAEYQCFVQATAHQPPSHWSGESYPPGRANHPVVNISWHDAVAYCRWLSEVTGKAYQLPSEAQWEKAARGSDGRGWPWGDEWQEGFANTWESGIHDTTPVGIYPQGKSWCHCLDMAGNVWEWVHDWFQAYPNNRFPDEDYGEKYKVLRGGSWLIIQWYARCTYRLGYYPHLRYNCGGFRMSRGSSSS
jgi:formylglycine-generating enzyme required for sulfatase activity